MIGRDVLTRTLYGAKQSILVAVVVVSLAVAIGSALGAISGFFGGLLGGAIMRLVDVTLSFPPVLLAMAVAASLGPGLRNAAIAMVIVWWPVYARLMRGQVLEVKEREHVEAAIAGGASRWRLLTKHILSLCWTPTLVNATMDFGQVVLLAASLSFIGLGARPPDAGMGLDDLRGRDEFLLLVDCLRAGHGDPDRRARLQFHRRRASRYPRPEDGLRRCCWRSATCASRSQAATTPCAA